MNKYELAVVLTTKIEDEERAASIEKIKEVIARFGGVVTNVDEWGKKRLAYEIQKAKEAFPTKWESLFLCYAGGRAVRPHPAK